ncbi:MAG: CorA family divalent cation transporter [Pseudomonadota bacterium]
MKRHTFSSATSDSDHSEHVEWIVIDGNAKADKAWLTSEFGLPEPVNTLVLTASQHSDRLHPESGVILRMVRSDTEQGDTLVGFNILVEADRLITVCFGVTDVVEDVFDKTIGKNFPTSAFRLLPQLVTALVKPLETELTALSDYIDDLEDRAMEDRDFDGDDDVVMAGRKALAFRRYLSPLGAELTFLSLNPHELPGVADIKYLRREAEYIGRLIANIETIHHRVTLLLNYLRNRDEEKLGRSMHKLALVATVFLPLTFVTGLLGINVAGVPDAHDPQAFWRVCVFLLIVAAASLFAIRWNKWM